MRTRSWLPLLLGFLTAVGPASTDMYLPAFPAIEAGLHAPPGAAQYTLAALLPETLPPSGRSAPGLIEQMGRYRAILREPGFRAHAAMAACGTFAFFAYLGGSSPVFIDGFGLSPSAYGALFGLCAAGLIGSAQLNARLLPRFGAPRLLRGIAWTQCAAALVLVGVAFARVHSLPAVLAPVFVMVSLQGMLTPNATVGALSHHAAHAGSASALLGTLQFLMGAVSGLLVGVFTDGTPRGMAALMLAGAIGLVAADRLRARRG